MPDIEAPVVEQAIKPVRALKPFVVMIEHGSVNQMHKFAKDQIVDDPFVVSELLRMRCPIVDVDDVSKVSCQRCSEIILIAENSLHVYFAKAPGCFSHSGQYFQVAKGEVLKPNLVRPAHEAGVQIAESDNGIQCPRCRHAFVQQS